MRMIYLMLLTLIAAPVWADPLDLNYGVNEMDINADGVKDMIVRSRWDIANAHSSDRFLVLVMMPPEGEPEKPIKAFEVWLYEDPRKDFMTLEGADCVLGAYVFSIDKSGMLAMTHYERPLGKDFRDPQRVTITEYKLSKSEEKISDTEGYGHLPGSTYWSFQKVREKVTKETYCDVRHLMPKHVGAWVRDDWE